MASPYFIGPSGGASASGAAGAKNYLGTVNGTNLNGDFELGNTSGWSLGNVSLTSNLPTGTPTFGSGANANLSISAVTSGKLAGTYSLSYASSAATTAGNLLASDAFTIDTEDQAKPMTVRGYYSPTSNPSNGNWSGTTSNSFGWAIYDVTNSSWIIPAGVFSFTQSSGVGIFGGTFQTSANGTQYRLVVFNANATSGAITVLFDDMFLGPQTAPIGLAGTDTVTYTPTITHGSGGITNATATGSWSRVGDKMILRGLLTFSGASAAFSQITASLPSGYTIDTAKLLSSTAGGVSVVGAALILDSGVLDYPGLCFYTSPSSFTVQYFKSVSGTNPVNVSSTDISNTAPFTFGSADSISWEVEVPISGWSSNVQMSNDTDTRVVAFRGTNTAGTSIGTSATLVPFATTVYDTHGAWATNVYTVPVTGYYRVSLNLLTAGITLATNEDVRGYIYKNGSAYAQTLTLGTGGTGTSHGVTLSATLDCKAGDTIQAYFQSSQATSLNTSAGWNSLQIERLSGPAVVAATESVNARYTTTAGQSISHNTTTIVDFGTKDFDSHNAVTTGASWKFTAPASGKFRLATLVTFTASTAWSIAEAAVVSVYKNGSLYANLQIWAAPATSASGINVGLPGSTLISLNAGDYIDVRVLQLSNSTIALESGAGYNHVSIERVGN